MALLDHLISPQRPSRSALDRPSEGETLLRISSPGVETPDHEWLGVDKVPTHVFLGHYPLQIEVNVLMRPPETGTTNRSNYLPTFDPLTGRHGAHGEVAVASIESRSIDRPVVDHNADTAHLVHVTREEDDPIG